jgi:hypothetical protein
MLLLFETKDRIVEHSRSHCCIGDFSHKITKFGPMACVNYILSAQDADHHSDISTSLLTYVVHYWHMYSVIDEDYGQSGSLGIDVVLTRKGIYSTSTNH